MDWKALTEVRTEEAKKIRRKYQKQGKDFSPRRAKELVSRQDDIMNNLTATQTVEHLLVSMPTNGINMPVKSTEKTSERKNSMKEISQKLTLEISQTTTYSVAECHVKHGLSLEKEADLKIHVELCGLNVLESLKLKNQSISSLRMLRESCPIMREIPLSEFVNVFANSDMQ